jgi:hypothetical protein
MSRNNYSPEGRNAFKLGLVGDNLSHLMGEILTIVDASTEGEKNKAIKDLIKGKFSDKQVWLGELAWKETFNSENGEGKINREQWENGLVPFDDSEIFSFK